MAEPRGALPTGARASGLGGVRVRPTTVRSARAGLPPRAADLGLIGCTVCGQVARLGPPARGAATEASAPPAARPRDDARVLGPCPRCGSPLRRRHGNLQTSAALLIAAAICYVPANLLPVMYAMKAGGEGGDATILSGVLDFWREGSWDIALIIFIASVVVPCVKFGVLGYLLAAPRRASLRVKRARARLYRLIEVVGYWSMLDVIVVALVSSAVDFGGLSRAEPRVGILYFGAVVVLTMLSAMTLDPRRLWDDHEDPPREHLREEERTDD